jgi:hypothetical protein
LEYARWQFPVKYAELNISPQPASLGLYQTVENKSQESECGLKEVQLEAQNEKSYIQE